MLTNLPILCLEKEGPSVVKQRLLSYNKSHFITCNKILDLLPLFKRVKQDYFFTIEPVLYFSPFWDDCFLCKNKKIQLKYENENENEKNIVIVTSKIITSSYIESF